MDILERYQYFIKAILLSLRITTNYVINNVPMYFYFMAYTILKCILKIRSCLRYVNPKTNHVSMKMYL